VERQHVEDFVEERVALLEVDTQRGELRLW
jgi:hypothetical protein